MRDLTLSAPAPTRWIAPAAVTTAATLAALTAVLGWQAPVAIVIMLALAAWAAAAIPVPTARWAALGLLLLLPQIPSGHSLGLIVGWSNGLTLSNLAPFLAAPMIAGAAWRGDPLLPRSWPPLLSRELVLLAWGLLTLVPWWVGSAPPLADVLTLLAHAAQLAAFLLLGAFCLGPSATLSSGQRRLLLVGLAVNDAVGLFQGLGIWPVASPLGQQQPLWGVRVAGLFYDANIYSLLLSWALLWLLFAGWGNGARLARSWPWLLPLTLATAANLVLTASRAGYLALAVGLLFLLARAQWRVVAAAGALLLLLAVAFPLRTWSRIRATASSTDRSAAERLDSMAEAWRQIQAQPYLGVGWGRALYLGVADRPVAALQPSALFHGAQDMPLTVWAETGPVGLLLFLWACAGPVRRLWASPRELPILAGYLGLLAGSLTIEALWNTRVLALAVLLTAGCGAGAS